ncbi:MAG: NDP-sugar synthase, partial [Clostridia bacterium]|nr:NDP-sugar synthase [Clostridia bacterium]
MQAYILAGGLGTRLYPLTQDLPKPLVPVANRPWLDTLLRRLATAGVRDVVIGLHHRREVFPAIIGDGARYGLRLQYVVEERPLGTGGAIRLAASYLQTTFVVFNADVVVDFSLETLLRHHRERGALASIALAEVEDTSAYGVVVTGSDGRIRRFVEKPRPGQVASRLINAGVYVFEPEVLSRIPAGRPVSLEREVFPELVESGASLYGFPFIGYWLDMGTPERYLQLHRDILRGTCRLPVEGERLPGGVWRGRDVRVEPGARLVGPALLGDAAVVEAGATVGPNVVLGRGCRVGAGAVVRECVLWD